jgi:hypothetical protein
MLGIYQEFTDGGRPQGGTIPEDLRDFVENVSAKDRPALALFRKTRVNSTFIEWLEDFLPARAHNAHVDGAGETDPDLVVPTRSFTHVQTFARWGRVDDVQRAVEHKGFADSFLYQEKKAIDATLNDIEHAVQRGSAATGATDSTRQFNGLLNALTTFMTDESGVTMIEDVFSDLVQLFVDGGTEIRPSVALVNSYLKRTISQYTTKVTRNIDAAARAQINVVERHSSDFGDIDIFYTRDQLKGTTKAGPGNSIVILDPSYFEVAFLQPLMSETLARNGLRTSFQISAMCTLIYRTQKAGGGARNVCPYIV